MTIIDREDINCNYTICKACGGRCCKRNACDCSPQDFGNDVNKMRKALESGKYSIDFSRKDATSFIKENTRIILDTDKVRKNPIEFFYIRPKNINRPIVDFIHREENEGPCIFWNKDTGCSLEYKDKPKGGRTMIPFPAVDCIYQYNDVLMAMDWKPFFEDLLVMAKEYFDKEWILYQWLNFEIK